MTDAAGLIAALEALASEEEREKYTRYFPPDPDAPFIGVRMGAVFDLAKTVREVDWDTCSNATVRRSPGSRHPGPGPNAAPHSSRPSPSSAAANSTTRTSSPRPSPTIPSRSCRRRSAGC